MAYSGLDAFVLKLEEIDQLVRIREFSDPLLEITEITDRVVKSGNGKALLFENNGTHFPLLINAFGSFERMTAALSRPSYDEIANEIESLFEMITSGHDSFLSKVASLPGLAKIASLLPSKSGRAGKCQQVIYNDPDLSILPVLKCWPFDGGRFITLPIVHTFHPETGKPNAGMYRMQILDRNTTAMHWQRHKTGANHFEAWKKAGRRMPVSVVLGGDPVYTYCATAPLPENISEYILAGFLRKRKVTMVKCITNEIYVPEDADIVLEGYVDPSEEPVWEGPFGDHTGFYSLEDWYPRFHVTCITHRKNAVYPATIVGIPPMEDSWFAQATEKIFLGPVKIALQPEITDMHMPDAGTAHNLMIVRINKTYPGQGSKIISSLSGAGQMMFSKYIVVVSGHVNIRNYRELGLHVLAHADLASDMLLSRGPLDVLDHSSDSFSFGGKAGIDATEKLPEESYGPVNTLSTESEWQEIVTRLRKFTFICDLNNSLVSSGIPVLILAVDPSSDEDCVQNTVDVLRKEDKNGFFRLVVAVDSTVDINDIFMVAWQVLGNSDPVRDRSILSGRSVFIDGTIKAYRKGGFSRRWPNVVCSSVDTIYSVDKKWPFLKIGEFVTSPSLRYSSLCRNGNEEITTRR